MLHPDAMSCEKVIKLLKLLHFSFVDCYFVIEKNIFQKYQVKFFYDDT